MQLRYSMRDNLYYLTHPHTHVIRCIKGTRKFDKYNIAREHDEYKIYTR